MPTSILSEDEARAADSASAGPTEKPVETVSQTQIKKANTLTYVTDERGRSIGYRKLRPLEAMDLTEIAGSNNSTNQAWMVYAMSAFSVFEIDGEKLPRPKTKQELRMRVQLLDDDGIDALIGALMPSEAEEASEVDKAKN